MAKENLWDYVIGMHESTLTTKVDTIFKAKNPRRYIQVKTSVINGGK